MANCDSYVICTSPRSGSTLLCKLLSATGIAGNPGSYFHCPSVAAWLDDLGLTPNPSLSEREVLNSVFAAAIAEGSLDTGMFGLRLQRHSFEFFTQKLGVLRAGFASDGARFEAAFGRTLFIHLSRHDKVEQAVSYVKAQQTGLWHMAPDGTELERLAPPEEPVYDSREIQAQCDVLSSYDRAWDSWFNAEDIEPLQITYEMLSGDPIKTLADVLEYLGLDRKAARGVKPGVAKLADETSRYWAVRFRQEHDIA